MATKAKPQPTESKPMATKIQPLGQRVLVKRIESEEMTAGGIFLPDTAKEKPQKGTVVAVGNGTKDQGFTAFAKNQSSR